MSLIQYERHAVSPYPVLRGQGRKSPCRHGVYPPGWGERQPGGSEPYLVGVGWAEGLGGMNVLLRQRQGEEVSGSGGPWAKVGRLTSVALQGRKGAPGGGLRTAAERRTAEPSRPRVAPAHSKDSGGGAGPHGVCCSLRAIRNHRGVYSLCFWLLLLFKNVYFFNHFLIFNYS